MPTRKYHNRATAAGKMEIEEYIFGYVECDMEVRFRLAWVD